MSGANQTLDHHRDKRAGNAEMGATKLTETPLSPCSCATGEKHAIFRLADAQLTRETRRSSCNRLDSVMRSRTISRKI